MAKQDKFSCPHCGLRYDVRPNWAGQRAKCKCCKNVFVVPYVPSATTKSSVQEKSNFALPEAETASPPPPPNPAVEPKSIPDTDELILLDPIEDPPTAAREETYQPTSPLHSEPKANDTFASPGNFEPPAAGDAFNPPPALQPQDPLEQDSDTEGKQTSIVTIVAQVLSSLLLLIALVIFLKACMIPDPPRGAEAYVKAFQIALMTSMFVGAGYCLLLACLGICRNRGAALNELLIKIWLILSITPLVLSTLGCIFVLVWGLVNESLDAGGITFLAGYGTFSLTVDAIIIYIWYLFLKKFGFFWPNAIAVVLTSGFVLFNGTTASDIYTSISRNQVANKNSCASKIENMKKEVMWTFEEPDYENMGSDTTRFNPTVETDPSGTPLSADSPSNNSFRTSKSENAPENPSGTSFDTTSSHNRPSNASSSATHENPFAPDVSNPPGKNPFLTSETNSEQSGTPSATSPRNDSNPFETDSDSTRNPFEIFDTKPITKEKKTDKPPSAEAAAIDRILDRLNGSTSGVQRILEALARYQPIDEKREAVCRTMIALLKNDKVTFAQDDIVAILAEWMTPKVSDEVVQVMKTSDHYATNSLIKELARVQDDKIAATVVELWTQKPFILKDAVLALGPRAEKPLWKILQSSNQSLQIEACRLLAQNGTSKSIAKLAKLAYAENQDRNVVKAAEEAIKKLSTKEE